MALNRTIKVTDIKFTRSGSFQFLTCNVETENLPNKLVFRREGDSLPAPMSISANWAAMALLMPAMLLGRDIEIDHPISPRLLFQLNGDLQALLKSFDRTLNVITVRATSAIGPRGDRVATGFSAGVDSFATLGLYTGPKTPTSLMVTDTCVFNVGAMGPSTKDDVKALFSKYQTRCKEFSSQNGYGHTFVDSNLSEFFDSLGERLKFESTHTLRNVAAAYSLEDLLGSYLYSSAYSYPEIYRQDKMIAKLDPLLLPLVSSESLNFISAGAGLSRGQKVALVAQDARAHHLLDVCVRGAATRSTSEKPNCSTCWKCRRTMVALDALGQLDNFESVFELEKFRSKQWRVLASIGLKGLLGSSLDEEVYNMAMDTGLAGRMGYLSTTLMGIARLKRRYSGNDRAGQ